MLRSAEVTTMNAVPLRYNISNWKQLSNCLSNNSRALRITVTDFIQNTKLTGLRISVVHPEFGTLFSTVLHAEGDLISDDYVDSVDALTNEEILNELAKFGFYVTYEGRSHLSQGQLDYLVTLQTLHFNKLRRLTVRTPADPVKPDQTMIVAFDANSHLDWMNNDYVPLKSDLDAALIAGTAINISTISDTCNYDWSWLDYVASIEDILEDNSQDSEG